MHSYTAPAAVPVQLHAASATLKLQLLLIQNCQSCTYLDYDVISSSLQILQQLRKSEGSLPTFS